MEAKNKRIEKELTQRELAEKVGISERGYQDIEYNKRRPNVEIAIKIAETLNTTVEELFKNS